MRAPRLAGLGAALVASVALAGGTASAGPFDPEGIDSARIASEAVDVDPGAVRDYWTPRRMRNAEPAGLSVTPSPRPTGVARIQAPAAAPSEIRPERSAVADAGNTAFPARVHGKVFFTLVGTYTLTIRWSGATSTAGETLRISFLFAAIIPLSVAYRS